MTPATPTLVIDAKGVALPVKNTDLHISFDALIVATISSTLNSVQCALLLTTAD